MRRFTFRLETLLRHRTTLEDLREQEFALAVARLEALKRELESLELHYRQTVAERPLCAGDGFDAPAIHSRERYLEALQERVARQAERVDTARMIADELRAAMVAARQAREAVTRLRDKDHEDYLAEQQQKAQDGLDEIASVRFLRRQSAAAERPGAAGRGAQEWPSGAAEAREADVAGEPTDRKAA
jgi:flagellar export protein FliJ